MRHVIAVDAGGTSMRAALLAPNGAVLHGDRRAVSPASPVSSASPVSGPVAGAVPDFVEELRLVGRRRFGRPAEAVGVALPVWDGERLGRPGEGHPFRDALAEVVAGAPVVLTHQVDAGAVAEAQWGAGRGLARFFYLAWGTEVAGARCEGGRAGWVEEFGHLPVSGRGRRCSCGAVGCLRTVAAASAVAEEWARVCGDPWVGVEHAAEAARCGDREALRVWGRAVEAVAGVLAPMWGVRPPGAVVVGGRLAEAGWPVLELLRGALARRLPVGPSLGPAATGDMAACVGAGLRAWEVWRQLRRAEGQLARVGVAR
ncbi:ROK family protein [Streptomyces sp. NPDC005438]|uniref:ROK family protein n=1 Tax=Streptomyces sp. NPDC005438 TaxID=3156880 RepID=UPI0033A54BC6